MKVGMAVTGVAVGKMSFVVVVASEGSLIWGWLLRLIGEFELDLVSRL
jgi:hypothetical protein